MWYGFSRACFGSSTRSHHQADKVLHLYSGGTVSNFSQDTAWPDKIVIFLSPFSLLPNTRSLRLPFARLLTYCALISLLFDRTWEFAKRITSINTCWFFFFSRSFQYIFRPLFKIITYLFIALYIYISQNSVRLRGSLRLLTTVAYMKRNLLNLYVEVLNLKLRRKVLLVTLFALVQETFEGECLGGGWGAEGFK
jgi:hypothetical protein